MTNKDIFDLIDRFEGSSLQSMKLTTGEFSMELSRGGQTAAPVTVSAAPAPIPEKKAGEVITAPLVGVFYAAPEPDAEPYVAVGDRVKKGQTVCLMEAMKMLSEVSAPCDCVITEVLKENGALASFGEPLFGYAPC